MRDGSDTHIDVALFGTFVTEYIDPPFAFAGAKTFWRSSAVFKNLPDMWAEMNQMKKEIKMLKEQLAEKQ